MSFFYDLQTDRAKQGAWLGWAIVTVGVVFGVPVILASGDPGALKAAWPGLVVWGVQTAMVAVMAFQPPDQ